MLSFNPTSRGWGRLAVATVASILVHCAVLMDSGEVVLLPASSTWLRGLASEGVTVVFRPHYSSELPSEVREGRQLFASADPFTPPEQESAGEKIKEHRLVPNPDDFLTQDRISVPAQPLSDINIPWPPGLPVMGVRSAVFTIFIDELGRVSDVVPDGHTLSPVMEEVARNAFLAAFFRPALLNGKAVKSIKRIEVEFEFLPAKKCEDAPVVASSKELL